ncbi:hypothetical protein BpHYR1_015720 [Brachionus plicatilis]|uniref:Uncharacterized protein n=1 Tax=Brachionus plicatilis TaxID=10195 RepID=A0A3M7RB65_BRAPC|nr:hypothetical protein BpHYR1_015720 [Brachionus plicatilis]
MFDLIVLRPHFDQHFTYNNLKIPLNITLTDIFIFHFCSQYHTIGKKIITFVLMHRYRRYMRLLEITRKTSRASIRTKMLFEAKKDKAIICKI